MGAFVYLYLFLSVPVTFDVSYGNITTYPGLTIVIYVGGAFLLTLLARLLRSGPCFRQR